MNQRCLKCNGRLNPDVDKQVVMISGRVVDEEGKVVDYVPKGWRHTVCYPQAKVLG